MLKVEPPLIVAREVDAESAEELADTDARAGEKESQYLEENNRSWEAHL